MMLSADELLAGGELIVEIDVPSRILQPNNGKQQSMGRVKLRPLTVKDLQRISRAAKDSDNLTATLMVQAALVEPALSVVQVASMHVGLVEFLLDQVNRISGISIAGDAIEQAASDPLARAAFILAREFGWTPQDINNLTLGQVVLHLEMLKQQQTS